MSSCNQALELAPRNQDAWDSLGFVNLKMRNDRQAIADYQTALQIDPYLASSFYGIGLADHDLGDETDSKSSIAKAEKLNPEVSKIFKKNVSSQGQ